MSTFRDRARDGRGATEEGEDAKTERKRLGFVFGSRQKSNTKTNGKEMKRRRT